MPYPKVVATRRVGDPIIAADGRYFILVLGEDNKTYQVKFNLVNTKGNQNELITHYIGTKMKAPVLCGSILVFSKRILDSIVEGMSRLISATPDSTFYKSNELFGIQWHDGARFAASEKEVNTFFASCKNKKSFFAIYSFDQYLRNYDRQYFNHMIVKKEEDKKPSHFYATIDGDRIFGDVGWSRLRIEKEIFQCFDHDFHLNLYKIVDDKNYQHVLDFAANVLNINDTDIDLLEKSMNDIYEDPKLEHAMISDILKYRKRKIIDACDGTCFTNVQKKRLSEYSLDGRLQCTTNINTLQSG